MEVKSDYIVRNIESSMVRATQGKRSRKSIIAADAVSSWNEILQSWDTYNFYLPVATAKTYHKTMHASH